MERLDQPSPGRPPSSLTFLELLPKHSMEESFFSEKNSSEAADSNGWISFFLVNFLLSGRRSSYRSVKASWTICEQLVPRRKRIVFGFSTFFGARFSSALLERAERGFLSSTGSVSHGFFSPTSTGLNLHLSQHCRCVSKPYLQLNSCCTPPKLPFYQFPG